MSIHLTVSDAQLQQPAVLQAVFCLIRHLEGAGYPQNDLFPNFFATFREEGSPVSFSPFDAQQALLLERFLSKLPRRSFEFMSQLRKRQYLSQEEALELLALDPKEGPRTLQGLSHAIARKSLLHHLPVPFVTFRTDQTEIWLWSGPRIDDAAESPEAPESQKEAPLQQATPQVTANEKQKFALPKDFIESLPEDSKRFVKLLYERGWMPLYEILTAFDLPRAMSLGRILEPISRQLKAFGIPKPFSKATVQGASIYLWAGVALPQSVPEPIRSPKTVKKRSQKRRFAQENPSIAPRFEQPESRIHPRSDRPSEKRIPRREPPKEQEAPHRFPTRPKRPKTPEVTVITHKKPFNESIPLIHIRRTPEN